MRCPHCGQDNPAIAAFCGECGRLLTAPTTPPTNGHGAVPTSADPAHSEPTRYLCAAVQSDPELAGRLVEGILGQQHRSVAASPDVDLPTVLSHAIAGLARRTTRDLGLAGVVGILVILVALHHLVAGVLLAYLAALVIVAGSDLYVRHGVLAGTLTREAFRTARTPTPDDGWRTALDQVASYHAGNITVYSGYSPFVGYGAVLDSWSFALDVDKPADASGPVRGFTTEEIHDHVATRVVELGLPGLTVTDRLFVNGRDIRQDTRFLPEPTGRPVTAVSPDLLRALLVTPEDRARPYLMIRVVGWQGDLALSVFCRFLRVGSYLFVEASFSLLTPIRQDYREVDSLLPTPSFRDVRRAVGRALWPAVPMLAASVPAAIGLVLAPLAERRRLARERREIARNPFYDYGSLLSARQAASDGNHHRYFQRLDSELYRKVVERRVLDALVEFLDDHGVATDDLVERQTTILNQGVMVTGGGSFSAGAVAVGANSQARSGPNQPTGPAPADSSGGTGRRRRGAR